jgi:arylsulfatase A-like enzyme
MLFGEESVPSARPEMVYNIHTTDDDVIGTSGAIRSENWKLLVNQELSVEKYLLFDIESDPNETTNLKDDFPEIFQQMLEKYNVSYLKIK